MHELGYRMCDSVVSSDDERYNGGGSNPNLFAKYGVHSHVAFYIHLFIVPKSHFFV